MGASVPHNLSGYVADVDNICHDCMVRIYSGRANQSSYPYRSYNNRKRVIRALRTAMDQGPYQYDIKEFMDRHRRSWSDAVGIAICWLGARLCDHNGDPILPSYSDSEETDYPVYCGECGKELDTIVLCHIDDRWTDGPCECEKCKDALEHKDNERDLRQEIRGYLQEARQYRKEMRDDPACIAYRKYSLQRAYQGLRVSADTLSRILYTADRPYRWARNLERAAYTRSHER